MSNRAQTGFFIGFFFSFRISVIFRQGQIKRIQLPDKTLIRRFVPIIAITVAYLVAWTSANRNTTQTRETNAGLKFTMCTENWWSYSAYGSRKYSYLPVNKIDICYELGITFYWFSFLFSWGAYAFIWGIPVFYGEESASFFQWE